ncbi:unnamed protein product [Chondrus crispus]|uniref:Uncharacterized protein n=1 Tax=Chondrus crispus TaxID=2769 RepID=R7QQI9_CHOCR|nr:unnamed protein product [Chondrus crispus]CDF39756.1 unnamed protein product [Chondrus crispus]|eukprot:XP_005710050.1 unnamed protein product [Chondrus crispus]
MKANVTAIQIHNASALTAGGSATETSTASARKDAEMPAEPITAVQREPKREWNKSPKITRTGPELAAATTTEASRSVSWSSACRPGTSAGYQ